MQRKRRINDGSGQRVGAITLAIEICKGIEASGEYINDGTQSLLLGALGACNGQELREIAERVGIKPSNDNSITRSRLYGIATIQTRLAESQLV